MGRSSSHSKDRNKRSVSRSHQRPKEEDRDTKLSRQKSRSKSRVKKEDRDSSAQQKRSTRRSRSRSASQSRKRETRTKDERSRSRKNDDRSQQRDNRSNDRHRSRSNKKDSERSQRRDRSKGSRREEKDDRNPRSRSRTRSREQSRGRSRQSKRSVFTVGSQNSIPEKWEEDTCTVSAGQMAFLQKKTTRAKRRIGRVTGCTILFDDEDEDGKDRDRDRDDRGDRKIRICGPHATGRQRASKYLKLLGQHRSTDYVQIDDDDDNGDVTLMKIPLNALSFVTGRDGETLRLMEDEWNVLIMFTDRGECGKRSSGVEELAIFGARRGRHSVELRALSSMETKVPGHFRDNREKILNRIETDKGDQKKMEADDESDGDYGIMTMDFKGEELAYALGKRGATRRKIEVSSGCITQYIGSNAIFVGKKAERERARKYIGWLFAQLDGPVYVKDWKERDDCCIVKVPGNCAGYVTGSKRSALSTMEEESGVLMFFMGDRTEKEEEELIIFGPHKNRLGASIKVKSTVEPKAKTYYTRGLKDITNKCSGIAIDIMYLKDEEISYALGARGITRKKLEKASDCVIQYVGNYAHFAGDKKERARGREYLNFLLAQRHGHVRVKNFKKRSDCLSMDIDRSVTFSLTSDRGMELRRVEDQTGTFCVVAEDEENTETDIDRLLILGYQEGCDIERYGRLGASSLIKDLIRDIKRRTNRRYSPRGQRRSRSRGGYGGGYNNNYNNNNYRGGGGRRPSPQQRYNSPRRSYGRDRSYDNRGGYGGRDQGKGPRIPYDVGSRDLWKRKGQHRERSSPRRRSPSDRRRRSRSSSR